MAAIDKIYGSRELKRFIRYLRLPGHNKRGMYRYFYPVGYDAMTNFPIWAEVGAGEAGGAASVGMTQTE